jgi:hypothetical protein
MVVRDKKIKAADKVYKVYISLPISGNVAAARERAARAKAQMSKIAKYEPITPFDACGDVGADYAKCMGKDIETLLGCDMVCFLSGWENSKGCCLEHHAADIYGIRKCYLNID